MTVLWDVTSCSLIGMYVRFVKNAATVYQLFAGSRHLYIQDKFILWRQGNISTTLQYIYHTTPCIANYNYNWSCVRYANVWRTHGMAPGILNLVSRPLQASATLSPPPHKKEPRYTLNRRLGGPQSGSGRLGEEINHVLVARIEARFLGLQHAAKKSINICGCSLWNMTSCAAHTQQYTLHFTHTSHGTHSVAIFVYFLPLLQLQQLFFVSLI
jgi:hypothetical protein